MHINPSPRRITLGFLMISLAIANLPAFAKIDLVTLPGRDSMQLTIYNSEDLTLVRESRTLTFSQGRNQIQFSWANTLIDPTSLQLYFKNRSEDFEILDITYPANTQNMLIWNVEAKKAGAGSIEIVYFTSGLTWQADYVARVNPGETEMHLEGYVRVTNNSGEDFENAQTRLVVGTINLVEKIAELARRGVIREEQKEEAKKAGARMLMMDRSMAMPASAAVGESMDMMKAVKEVVKQAVSEYQLYTIEGTEDLPNQWSKRLRSFSIPDAKLKVAYEHNPGKYGDSVVKFYKLFNNAEHNLGKAPLPDGAWRVFRDAGKSGFAWEGQDTQKYIPVGEKVELNMGSDGLVVLEPKRMKFQRTDIDWDEHKNVIGYITHETWRLEVRNSKPAAIPIKITRYFQGDWDIDPKIDMKTVQFKKKDQSTVEFETQAPAASKTTIEYILTTRLGTRSNGVKAAAPSAPLAPSEPSGPPSIPQRPKRTPKPRLSR